MTAHTADAERSSDELTHRQITTIIIGLMSGMFLAALDQNVVGTAMKTIADELHGLDQQVWVTTAYLITSTISTPIYGKLSDLYGRKKFFLDRDHHLHHRVVDVLLCHVDADAVHLPRRPGSGRRRSVLARSRDRRRHRPAA